METVSRTLLTFLLNALWQVPLAWAVAALACRLMPNGPRLVSGMPSGSPPSAARSCCRS